MEDGLDWIANPTKRWSDHDEMVCQRLNQIVSPSLKTEHSFRAFVALGFSLQLFTSMKTLEVNDTSLFVLRIALLTS